MKGRKEEILQNLVRCTEQCRQLFYFQTSSLKKYCCLLVCYFQLTMFLTVQVPRSTHKVGSDYWLLGVGSIHLNPHYSDSYYPISAIYWFAIITMFITVASYVWPFWLLTSWGQSTWLSITPILRIPGTPAEPTIFWWQCAVPNAL